MDVHDDTIERRSAGRTEPLAPAAAIGRVLDGTPYRALALLGHGGMGEIVVAEHRTLGKQVVVKLLHARFAEDAHLADRLRVEAQALARLSHENLVAVHDLGQTPAGRPYYVMDRLHGQTLRDELAQRGALPVVEAVSIARQALAGLAVAHAAGLVHRDVKLDNLFLCELREGRRILKVLDFGVAKVLDVGAPSSAAPAPTQLPTQQGFIFGTPQFFSPEQALGAPVDARSDVYAMGLVLYALVAGRGPFDHLQDAPSLVRAHAFEPSEPPSRHAPQPVPAAVERAIEKAMAKNPEERFQSAESFAEALCAIERDLPGALAAGAGAGGDLATQPLCAAAESPPTWMITAPVPPSTPARPPLPWSVPAPMPGTVRTIPLLDAGTSPQGEPRGETARLVAPAPAAWPPSGGRLPPGERHGTAAMRSAASGGREAVRAWLFVGLTVASMAMAAAALMRWWMG